MLERILEWMMVSGSTVDDGGSEMLWVFNCMAGDDVDDILIDHTPVWSTSDFIPMVVTNRYVSR